MAEAATPAAGEEKDSKGQAPDQQAANPASGSQADPNAKVDPNKAAPAEGEGDNKKFETLEEAQVEIERLSGESGRVSARNSELDKKENDLKTRERALKKQNKASNKVAPKPKEKDDEENGENGDKEVSENIEEMRTAEIKVSRLLLDPKYRPLLDSDPTLLSVLQRNPLTFVDDFIDAEDAMDQTRDMLDEKLSKLPPPKKDEEDDKKDEENEGGNQFSAGAPNTRSGAPSAKTPEEHRKDGNTDAAVESSILGKMNIPRK